MGEYEKMMMINKGKGIAVRTRANNNYSAEDDDNITSPLPSAKVSPRSASSKYDFVKVLSLEYSF